MGNVIKNVCVVGLGYVGLPLAELFIKNGYATYGIDTDKTKLGEITQSKLGFEGLSAGFTSVSKVEAVVICVPTPVNKDKTPDLRIINNCIASVARNLRKDQLVVIESTVYPGYCDDTAIKLIEENSNLKVGEDIFLAHCPERINPGDMKWNVENIARVIGGFNKKSLSLAVNLYESILKANVLPMKNMAEAEAVKIVENSFRDINIAFVNELAMSFSEIGIDTLNVIKGASTKPFGYMPHFPSIGVGGHCIPVDPYYLIESANKRGFIHKFLSLGREVNEGMVPYVWNKIEVEAISQGLNIRELNICVLGLAYKANQSDLRESPGVRFVEFAKEKGSHVKAYDPFIPEHSEFKSMDEVLPWADVIVIAAGHDAFKDLSTEAESNKVKIIADGCNILENTNIGAAYFGVGR